MADDDLIQDVASSSMSEANAPRFETLFEPPGAWRNPVDEDPIAYMVVRMGMRPKPVGVLWAADQAAGYEPAMSEGPDGAEYKQIWTERVTMSRVATAEADDGVAWNSLLWLTDWNEAVSGQGIQFEGPLTGTFGDIISWMEAV